MSTLYPLPGDLAKSPIIWRCGSADIVRACIAPRPAFVTLPGMNSRQRMLAAFDHQPVDRLPTDIWATPEVWDKLTKHFASDRQGVLQALHIDAMEGIGPQYIGPTLPVMPEGQSIDYWGRRMKRVDYGAGAYDEQYFYPLGQARSIDDLERYPWPSPAWFDYSAMRDQAAAARQKRCRAMRLHGHLLLPQFTSRPGSFPHGSPR